MNNLPRLILISGWAHGTPAMEDLGKCLEGAANFSYVTTGDLWRPEQPAGSQSACARNLAVMIEKTSGKVFIAGWSLGGMIALETAFHRPDLFNGLVLISSTAKFCSGPGWPAGIPPAVLRTMTRKFKRDRKEVLRDFFRNVAMPSAETDENILLKIEKACAMNPLELSAGLEYLSEADLRGKIVKLKVPALVLHGRQDLVIPAEAGMALKDMLALSKIRVYDNYGHGLPWQNPRAVAGDIKEFLQECRKRDTQQARL